MTPFDLVLQRFAFPSYIDPHLLQLQVINERCNGEPNSGLWLDMGCVDAHTEYLSPTGWVPISQYQGGKVAQYHPYHGGRIEFVSPDDYIKKPCPRMIRIRTKYGVDQLLSPEHRVLLEYAHNPLVSEVLSAEELLRRHNRWVDGHPTDTAPGQVPFTKAAIPVTFDPAGGTGIDLSDADLRLQIAVVADGHFPNSGTTCVVRLKKQRKIERLRRLLEAARRPYKAREQNTATATGFVVFTFEAPTRDKEFGPAWWNATPEQLGIVTDEVMHWDGSVSGDKPPSRFSTMVKSSADFVQYAFSATGRTARVLVSDRGDKGVEYTVSVRPSGRALQLCSTTSEGERRRVMAWEPSPDGFKYCFSVPSTFLLFRRNGCVFASGNTGKTFCSTAIALYRHIRYGDSPTVVIMPPNLARQWEVWIRSITDLSTGAPVSVVRYAGTPAKRKQLKLRGPMFVLVGVQIFCRDYARFLTELQDTNYFTIIDEATIIGNIGTKSHDMVHDFAIHRARSLLSGTPTNKPADAYGLMKLTAPGTYLNYRRFEDAHVGKDSQGQFLKDPFGRVKEYINLDLLKSNLMRNSSRVLYEDMYPNAEAPLYVPIEYDLEPEHMKLYERLCEEKMLELEGEVIDATSSSRMMHALGQIILNWDHFGGDPKLTAAGISLVEEKLQELGDKKLLVFANYKMTVRRVTAALQGYGAVAYNSEVSERQKHENLQRFINDPTCRVMVIQFVSGGKGLDGAQHVCHHAVFIEPCEQPRDFHQCVARIKRTGQRRKPMVMLAIASGTVHHRRMRNLVRNDTINNKVIRTAVDLRKELFGRE